MSEAELVEKLQLTRDMLFCYSQHFAPRNVRSLTLFKLPTEPIVLKWNPLATVGKRRTKEDRKDAFAVRRIFKDRVARQLWLGIRPQVITSQHFLPDIEMIARELRRDRKKLKCWHDLRGYLYGADVVFRNMTTFMTEAAVLLWPYVAGEREFEWKYVEEVRTGIIVEGAGREVIGDAVA